MAQNQFLDVGSNLGGFLFYLDKFGRRDQLLGIEGQPEFAEECKIIAGLINSSARFHITDVMKADTSTQYDAIILQNVHHYIFDKVGNHDDIFEQLASLGRSIIWYNPMSPDDPVIPKHAHSNRSVDWSTFNKGAIFESAIKAGLLHPIPLPLRFRGMGEAREHWLFILDQRRPLRSRTIFRSHVRGEIQNLKPHFKDVHSVTLDDARSYKTFISNRGQISSVLKAIDVGILDGSLCDTIDIIVDDETRQPIGYSQPRGVPYNIAAPIVGASHARALFTTQAWRLVSRLTRHNAFYHDIGQHNAVFPPFVISQS